MSRDSGGFTFSLTQNGSLPRALSEGNGAPPDQLQSWPGAFLRTRHGARTHESGVFPDRIKNLVTGKDAAGVAGKIMQQPEFCCRGGDYRAAHGEHHGERINFEVASADHRGSGRRFTAPQDCLYARHQLTRTEGLGDVVVRSDLKATYAISFAGTSCHKDDRRAA